LSSIQDGDVRVVAPEAVDDLIEVLIRRGYHVIGPIVRDGALVHGELTSGRDLPVGVGAEQDAGRYRLKERADRALFGFAVGPSSWKQELLPQRELVWTGERSGEGWTFTSTSPRTPPVAFLGVRPCDLAAIAIQDRVLDRQELGPTPYRARRDRIFTVVVECGEPAATCFCASAGTGPAAGPGGDLVVTEIVEPDRHELVVGARSQRGAEVLGELGGRDATVEDRAAAAAVTEAAAARMERSVDIRGVASLLARNPEDPRWDDVAARCLACANCTLVCPTCFCTTIVDTGDLSGDHAERWSRWASCFDLDFSHMASGAVRPATRSRYRQWLTHKFSSWWEQFGTSGCVGCGRCIAWCPVGIDVTEELAAIGTEREVTI
jgi:formate hydrogenlyase subunit 6/NADH:ubiquinone oxidoreductase subunit I